MGEPGGPGWVAAAGALAADAEDADDSPDPGTELLDALFDADPQPASVALSSKTATPVTGTSRMVFLIAQILPIDPGNPMGFCTTAYSLHTDLGGNPGLWARRALALVGGVARASPSEFGESVGVSLRTHQLGKVGVFAGASGGDFGAIRFHHRLLDRHET